NPILPLRPQPPHPPEALESNQLSLRVNHEARELALRTLKGTPPLVYVSYSAKHKDMMKGLLDSLAGLRNGEIIDFFLDEDAESLDGPRKLTVEKIAQSSIAILVLTPAFVASTGIVRWQLPEIAKRHNLSPRHAIVPIFALHCEFEYSLRTVLDLS